MHISHDVIATKTCPSYEFSGVFGQVRVRSVWEWAKFLKLLRVRGGTQNFNPCKTLVGTCICKAGASVRSTVLAGAGLTWSGSGTG